VNVPVGGVAWPKPSSPQQTTLPLVRMPHVCSAPASTDPRRVPAFALLSTVSAGAGTDPALTGTVSATLASSARTMDTTTAA